MMPSSLAPWLWMAWMAGPAVDLPLQDPAQQPQLIVGGSETADGEWEGVVAIQAGTALCTGTVVAPRLVLTAGHCLAGLGPSDELRAYFGQNVDPLRSTPGTSFGVHPDFCADSSCDEDIFDFGFVTIGTDFTVGGGFTTPVVTQQEWDLLMNRGQSVTLVGFGETGSSIGPQNGIGIKREVQTSISRLTGLGLEFFAGGDGADSCTGDSGGPAFARLPDGTTRLVGITSRGSSPCGDGGFYGAPAAALCWLRDETDVDLTDGGCCDCLETAPPSDGCRVDRNAAPPSGPTAALWTMVVVALRRRRRG